MDMVRTPQPENITPDSSQLATCVASRARLFPDHSKWTGLECIESICLFAHPANGEGTALRHPKIPVNNAFKDSATAVS